MYPCQQLCFAFSSYSLVFRGALDYPRREAICFCTVTHNFELTYKISLVAVIPDNVSDIKKKTRVSCVDCRPGSDL